MSAPTRMHVSGRTGFVSDLKEAAIDIIGALLRWRLWTSLALHDVASRYRGSVLGPLWITVTTGAMVGGMGLVYSQLFNMSLAEYIPWLAVGIVLWSLYAVVISEGCDTFIASNGIIKQTALPMFTFLGRMVFRNLINFAHQLVIVIAVVVWFGLWKKANAPMALVGFMLSMGNLLWIALICGIVSARFRDVPQIVTAVMQVLMFLTPVFWRPEAISAHRFVLTANPFYYMMEATRRPLLGEQPIEHAYGALAIMLVVGWAVAFVIFARTRRRVVHYL
jgi:ABC-type polysaccharide/polyol phosphate export permease